jgi:hypothetical protein
MWRLGSSHLMAAWGAALSAALCNPAGGDERTVTVDIPALLNHAMRFAAECPELNVDVLRMLEVAKAGSSAQSSLLASNQDVARSLAKDPSLGPQSPPGLGGSLSRTDCDYGYSLYGPKGEVIAGLLTRIGEPAKQALGTAAE